MSSLIHWLERLRVQPTGYILNLFTIVRMPFKHVNQSISIYIVKLFCLNFPPKCGYSDSDSFTPWLQLSYLIVDLIIWWGTRGFINDFRKKLNLPPIAYFSTYHGSISHLPTGYMWSPHLMPKPNGILILLKLTLRSSLFIS